MSGIRNFHKNLPSTLYYVYVSGKGQKGYFGPYDRMGTARSVATQKCKKGLVTTILCCDLRLMRSLIYPTGQKTCSDDS